MKNKGLIITLIIILCIIIMGLIALLYFCLNGKLNLKFGFINWGKRSSNIIFDTSYETDEVDNLKILSSAGNINFVESEDGKIRVIVYGEDNNDLKVAFNANTLKIDYSNYKNKGFGFFNYNINDITIYIPKDYSKEINIDTDYGDVNIIDLEKASITIEEDCGSIKIGKVKNITIKNNYGDIDIDTILNKCTIEADCGNIKINEFQVQEDSFIKSNYGNIKIRQINDIYIDAKTDLGDVKINANNRHSEITLKIENDCGDIKVEN